MQTQKDHVDADRFQSLRVADAITFGNTPHLEVRARRAGVGLVVGVVIAVLVMAAVGVYGLINPGGSTQWKQAGSIIVDRDTGTRMVLRGGSLHAVPNYTSARLIEGADAKVVTVGSNSLSGTPRGAAIGISGAPDDLPAADDLNRGAVMLCLSGSAAGSASSSAGLVTMVAGTTPATAVSDRGVAWVRDAAGTRWVVRGGTRYEVRDDAVPVVLGLQSRRPVAAAGPWLATLPVGVPLAAPAVPSGTGPQVGSARVPAGSLFTYTAVNGTKQRFIAYADGLAEVPRMEFSLLRTRAASRALSAEEVAQAPRSARVLPHALPDLLVDPPLDVGATPLCATLTSDGVPAAGLRTVTPGRLAALGAGRATSGGLRIALGPQSGLYASAVDTAGGFRTAAASNSKPILYLITADGTKYRVASSAAASALGYGDVAPRPLSDELLTSLRTGPTLSRSAVGVADR